MSTFKAVGLVVKYADYKEYDRMLTILSPQYGKIDAIARGCRKNGSRLTAGAQPFAYAEYVFNVRGNLCSVTQVDMRESFYDLRMDLNKLTAGAFILDACATHAQHGQSCEELFELSYYTLSFICYGKASTIDLMLTFVFKLMDILGFRPATTHCGICEKSTFQNGVFHHYYGALCEECAQTNGGMHTDPLTLEALRRMLSLPLPDLYKVCLPETVRSQLKQFIPGYSETHLEKRYKPLKFIDLIDNDTPNG